MLRFVKKSNGNSRILALKSQQEDPKIETSKIGKAFHGKEESEKSNNTKSFYTKILLGLGIAGLVSGCGFLIFDFTVLSLSLLVVGAISMIGIPISRQLIGREKNPEKSNKPGNGGQALGKELEQFLDKKPKIDGQDYDDDKDSEFSESFEPSDEDFSDQCPAATEDDFEGITGLGMSDALKNLRRKLR